MQVSKLLKQEQDAILNQWFRMILETYNPETASRLLKGKNQFSNPVGHTLRQGLEGVYGELAGELRPEKMRTYLDLIIRVRAVQEFSPAQAIAFVFLLKNIIREKSKKEAWTNLISQDDLLEFEQKIDELALLAFNVYSDCREKLYELRVNEVKNRSFRLLQRANLLAEIPELEEGSGESDA
ncbi:MAG: RsbRD N-terminal domain-containing protein [Syntrophobacteraceae bacterium]|nr:RsbRD N-terminal domain-containing protein [Syntrophobacteraceae bacterium]